MSVYNAYFKNTYEIKRHLCEYQALPSSGDAEF